MVLKTEIALTENRADFRSRLKTRYGDATPVMRHIAPHGV